MPITHFTDKKITLDTLRHSCAHLLAQAVQELYPEAQVTIGPVIEDGFYYDFYYPKGFTESDLEKIEARMHKIAKSNLVITREIWSREKAIAYFMEKGEIYKVDIIRDIPENQPLSFYKQGEFIDLCRGPHVESTGKLKAFKLTKLAGAYWRGDHRNAMLQRIYGTAWHNTKELKAYLHRLEEAQKRDHRKLAKKYDLFHFQDIAPGMVFWHPHGWTVYQTIKNYIRGVLKESGYQEIHTPQLLHRSLWERSGHWEKFQENMFSFEIDGTDYAIKPMNCPCHVQIFNQGVKSYRDLPLRYSEFGSCHRNEPSGALHGLFRVRNFVQDDAHIFCTEDQIQSEVAACIGLVFNLYGKFGFQKILFKLSTRPAERVGAEALWDKAEQALETALKTQNLDFELCEGEGAFYGPKIDFFLKDSLERIWQCATIQVDFMMPERLNAHYIAQEGHKAIPVMIHRAIFGSIERFLGILLEECSGTLPVWLSPEQAVVMGITDKQEKYVKMVHQALQNSGIRVKQDLRNEKIGFKIREHTLQKIPYLLVVGEKECQDETISVRTREGQNLGVMNLKELTNLIKEQL